jgi:RNA polymerase primary sigma factor
MKKKNKKKKLTEEKIKSIDEILEIPETIPDEVVDTDDEEAEKIKEENEEKITNIKESLYAYFDEIRREQILSEKEEKKLILLAKKGDNEARSKLIKANLKLVVKIAKRYENFGVPLIDLIEEGNIGLMRAIEKFSLRKGFRFSTYATWWIKQSITRAITNQKNIIRIPVHILDIYHKYLKFVEKELRNTGSFPSREVILKKLKIDSSKLDEILNIIKLPKSLDLEYEDDESDSNKTLKDSIEDKSFIKPDDDYFEKDKKEKIIDIIQMLKPKEQQVILYRFGILDGKNYTLEEIGKKIKLTRERVRQIEAMALRKLREIIKNKENL